MRFLLLTCLLATAWAMPSKYSSESDVDKELDLLLRLLKEDKRGSTLDERFISRLEDVGADWSLIHLGHDVMTQSNGYFSLRYKCLECQQLQNGVDRQCPASSDSWKESAKGWRLWKNLDSCGQDSKGRDMKGCIKIENLQPACTYATQDGYKETENDDAVYVIRPFGDKKFTTLAHAPADDAGSDTATTENSISVTTPASGAQGDHVDVTSPTEEMEKKMSALEARLKKVENVLKKMSENLDEMQE